VSLRIVNLRARIEDQGGDALLAGSLDEYTLVKSAYLQNRKNLIWDGNPPYDPAEDGSEEAPAPSTDAPPVSASPPPK
jgi:phospholipid-binding lipoprotein MlaA